MEDGGDGLPDIVGVWFVCVLMRGKVVRGWIVNVLTLIVNMDACIVNI